MREGEVAQAARAEASEAAARRESTLVVEVKEGGGGARRTAEHAANKCPRIRV